MWGWQGHVGYGWMWLWWLLTLGIIGVVVWIAVAAGRRGHGPPRPGEDDPESVLKRRYARGEIDRETYTRMLEDLRK